MDRKSAKSFGKLVDFLSRFRGKNWGEISRFRGENWGEMSRFRGENWGEMSRFWCENWGEMSRFRGEGEMSRFRGENWGDMSRFRGENWGEMSRFWCENWGEGEVLNPGETARWSWLNLGDFVYSRSCAILGVRFKVSSPFLKQNILKFIVSCFQRFKKKPVCLKKCHQSFNCTSVYFIKEAL